MGGVLLLLAAIGLTFSITAQYFAAKAAAGFGRGLRHDLFKHIGGLSYTQIDQYGPSTFITRMTADVNQIQNQVNMMLRLLLRSPFIVIGAMIMAFTVDLKTAVVFAVAIPGLSVIVFGIMLITIPMYKVVQNSLDVVMGHTRENLSGTRVIRAFNREAQEVKEYNEETQVLNRFQIIAGRISTLMNPATFIIINVAIIAILWYGGIRVNVGGLSQGQVVALVNYMSQILVELIKLASLIINLTKAFACANRVNEIFDIPCEEDMGTLDNGPDLDTKVEFDNVSLTYDGAGESSIEGVNLKVKSGETIGVIGGTGSGKTTLLNVLSAFIPHDERIVTIEDAAELKLMQDHVVSLESRPANLERTGAITIRDLVKNALRMRPDRIVVGEVRGGETLDMLQAMNTGHDGSLTTAHANSARDALARIETMVMMAGMDLPVTAIRQQCAGALDLVVQQARLRDGSRKITSICEITGMEGDIITTQEIFKYVVDGMDKNNKFVGHFESTGVVPKCCEKVKTNGVDMDNRWFFKE